MYKLETQLAYFRFNSIRRQGNLKVTWYALEYEKDAEEGGRCFTKDELDKFLGFVTSKPNNFPGSKNHHPCNEDETPFCSVYSLIPNDRTSFPKNLILRKNPQLNTNSNIYDCMDIVLTDQNGVDNHNYNLKFNVIGRIEID